MPEEQKNRLYLSDSEPFKTIIQALLQELFTVFHDGNKTIVFNHTTNDISGNIEFIKADFNSAGVVLEELYKLNISSVIIEGGAKTLQCFIDENLWDEALVIKGNCIFENGVKGPKFNHVPTKALKTENDMHFCYVNQTLH
jgi:diaminohydroxyphosphoribosylaminopyrimidine deaminase/5-amino-6-(5-phosphoribosylamino)uracil reductase